jgi:hypothetical protein
MMDLILLVDTSFKHSLRRRSGASRAGRCRSYAIRLHPGRLRHSPFAKPGIAPEAQAFFLMMQAAAQKFHASQPEG